MNPVNILVFLFFLDNDPTQNLILDKKHNKSQSLMRPSIEKRNYCDIFRNKSLFGLKALNFRTEHIYPSEGIKLFSH